jgi:hypothetical protein
MSEAAAVRVAGTDRVVEPRTSIASTFPAILRNTRIREATFDDYRQVTALQARNGLSTKSQSDWCALWSSNPAYLRASHELPIGWVLESGGGDVVGFLGNLPLSYRFRGRDLLAATAHSWVVEDGYRGYAIRLLDVFLKQRSMDLLVFTTVNTSAEVVLRALRLNKVPVGRWDTAKFWITGYRGFARSAMAAHSIPMPYLCAAPLAGALWVRDRVFRQAYQIGSEFQIDVRTDFDARFDQFWEKSEKHNPGRLWAVRDAETLRWHYRAAIARGAVWIVTARLRGEMVAYWVVDRQDHQELGLKRLRFVDFQALSGYENSLRTAVAWMLEKCRQENIHIADNLGSWLEAYNIPGTVGPYCRKMKSWLFYYRARRGELAERLQDPSVWAPSSYDGDASL